MEIGPMKKFWGKKKLTKKKFFFYATKYVYKFGLFESFIKLIFTHIYMR